MAPENETGVCVEIFCDKDDVLWKKPDIDIAHEAIRDLPGVKRTDVKDWRIIKLEYGYPIYDIHYNKNLKVVKDYLARYKNMFLLGRTGSFRYINMDEVIKEGLGLWKKKEIMTL